MATNWTYAEISVVKNRPEWFKACSQPLRELVMGTDCEQTMKYIIAHFAKRGASPDVACRYGGQLYMAAP